MNCLRCARRPTQIQLSAGGLFSVPKMLGILRKYVIPYTVATLATYYSAEGLESLHFGVGLTIFLEWLSENGGYYTSVWLCDKFAPVGEKTFQEGQESLKQLLVVEGIDAVVRFGLLLLATRLPQEYKTIGAGVATAVADVSFALTLTRSHRLLEVCDRGLRNLKENFSLYSCGPEFLTLVQ